MNEATEKNNQKNEEEEKNGMWWWCHVESGWVKLKWILVGPNHMGSRDLGVHFFFEYSFQIDAILMKT